MTHALTSEGADASEDGTGRGTPIIVGALTRPGRLDDNEVGGGQLVVTNNPQPIAFMHTAGIDIQASASASASPTIKAGHDTMPSVMIHENQRGEVTTSETAGSLKTGGGKPGQGYPCVVQPAALRGREGGAQIELGAEGAPYNALRAGDGGSSRQSLITVKRHADTTVRRLTPVECERLQGYPDNWTDGQADAQRYRQLGNSVAVPVVEWLARRLVAVDRQRS